MRSLTFLKNFFIGSLGLLLKVILNFTVRTVFIYTLSEAYLGINGLFVNILSKFNERTIFIVDHNVDDINENVVYEVTKSDNGNIYFKH